MTGSPSESVAPPSPLEQEFDEVTHVPRSKLWLTRLAIVAVCLVAAYIIVELIGNIDWAGVADALGQLEWWQPLVLLLPLMIRQILNALPLAFFINGLGVYRAVVNDLASHLLAVVVPPPGDMVMRVGMFTSWGIDASKAIAGSLMNMLAFYIMRFSVPVLGVIILLPVRYDSGYAVTAAIGAAIAGAIAVLIMLSLRSEAFAERIGRTTGNLATKVRRSIDAEVWAAAVVEFRADMKGTFASGYPRSALALVGLALADATVLLMSLRFVGVPAAELPAVELYAAFLCAYPFTIFPFMGLGIVDAILLATIVEVAGLDFESAAVAGLIVWRTFTLGGPIVLGAGSLALWKHGVRTSRARPIAVEHS